MVLSPSLSSGSGDTMISSAVSDSGVPLITFLRRISGQEKDLNIVEIEHSYSKSWNVHPDPNIKSRPARFLFMSHFPKHQLLSKNIDDEVIDVDSVDSSATGVPNPLIAECSHFQHKTQSIPDVTDSPNGELQPPNKNGWSPMMHKLWNKSLKILQSDRLARLSYESLPNEMILKKNLMDRTCNKFRHLFASVSWDFNILCWLHSLLSEHVSGTFLLSYHEAMQILRQKLPSLVDKFYTLAKNEPNFSITRSKISSTDPILSVLNNHKPKRITGSPLFLIIPNGPQIPHLLTSQRMKHWHNLFGSLGKVITVTINQKPMMRTSDCLLEIRLAVRDKIKECKATFNEGRPLVLVGFGASSLIAAHCALNNAAYVNATICLGFPLTGINGFRGVSNSFARRTSHNLSNLLLKDLDDPLLETTVPTLFVIGQNSTMSTLDDMEDFRERITKAETGLIVVGGANDRLILCSAKKRFTGITQAMVDRCICDEISDFVSYVISRMSSETHLAPSTSALFGFPSSSSRNHASLPKSTFSNQPKLVSSLSSKKKRKKPRNPKKAEPESVVSPIASPNEVSEKNEENANSPVITKKRCLESSTQNQNEPKPAAPEEVTPKEEVSMSNQEEQKPTPNPSSEQAMPQPPQFFPGGEPANALFANLERHYGWSYGVSEVPTVISSNTTRTRHIRAPKQLDM
ncbi:KAT8 regulatory NSL complex subunit 3-like protein [Dinothrombium tinctorium]|uniref:KAT8 regulatory NSL complex subunit 3-like protein n=1 Tax=Dinothrombium tinctorium TaxID=1965070 RepID=A0A3S3PNW1_9ACAR|nr:KAT8 regulatory NSL complex subunit 3-like protein [Dinothrombium tinctorium]